MEKVQELLSMLSMDTSDEQSLAGSKDGSRGDKEDGSKGAGSKDDDSKGGGSREDLGSNQEQNMAAAELPKATSPKAKKPRAKAKAVKTEPGKATKPKNAITVFRKEYYKNTSTYGVRKYEDGKKKGLATTSLYPNSSWTS